MAQILEQTKLKNAKEEFSSKYLGGGVIVNDDTPASALEGVVVENANHNAFIKGSGYFISLYFGKFKMNEGFGRHDKPYIVVNVGGENDIISLTAFQMGDASNFGENSFARWASEMDDKEAEKIHKSFNLWAKQNGAPTSGNKVKYGFKVVFDTITKNGIISRNMTIVQ